MSHAEKCPICLGKGSVSATTYWAGDPEANKKTCYGCGGKGWITVRNYDFTEMSNNPPERKGQL